MRVALDTNVLIYAFGGGDVVRNQAAIALIERLGPDRLVLPLQVAGEFFNVATRKLRSPPEDVIETLGVWSSTPGFTPHGEAQMSAAFKLCRDHQFQIWDALILCTAADAGCALLLSEDMQDGFVYRGTTVANPFSDSLHPLLASLLNDLPGARP